MSSSIAIPKRKGKAPAHDSRNTSSSSSSSSSASSSSFASPSTPHNYAYGFTPSPNRFSYGGGSGSPRSYGSSSPASSPQGMRRRESLMSETFSRQEHIVVNVGGGEEEGGGGGGLRLISCVKASQGFDWNQEMFLPSYIDYHFDDLERRQDPVQDIILTDEEVRNMFPSDTRL